MKKIYLILFILAAVLSGKVVNAQAKVGIKMGADFSNIWMYVDGEKINKDADMKRVTSPRLGFFVDIPVSEEMFIHTGVFGAIKGTKIVEEDYKEIDLIQSINFPIHFGYKLDLGEAKLFAMAGPVIGLNTYTTMLEYDDGEIDNVHQTIGTTVADTYKPLDLGVNLEVGVEINRFQFSTFYTQGLNNITNSELDFFGISIDTSAKTSVIGIAAAIKFGSVDNGRRRRR